MSILKIALFPLMFETGTIILPPLLTDFKRRLMDLENHDTGEQCGSSELGHNGYNSVVLMLKADYHYAVWLSMSQLSTVLMADGLIDILSHKGQRKSLNAGFHTPVESKDILFHPES